MPRGRTTTAMTTRLGESTGAFSRPDRLVVEEPMEIRLDDHVVTTTMRTPGHDYELAVGFCVTEGLLAGETIRSVRYCATGSADSTHYNVVTVSTGGRAPVPEARLRTATSSCGLCGSASLDSLRQRLAPLEATAASVDIDAIGEAARQTRARQPLFDATGSIHAASTFDPASGTVDVVREDIGRHNAVDKVVGRLALDGRLPALGTGLLVSGRASFEIVQKAWSAGFTMVAAVSGPSALALETARAANIVLVGFVRSDGRGRTTANQYSPEPRLSEPRLSARAAG